MNADRRRELASRMESLDLPLLPEAAQRVMSAAEDPNVDPRALSELIERDPGLTGHLLRVANSPAYAAAARVSSLSQAVSRLGMKAIAEIALVVSCQTRVFGAAAAEEVRDTFAHSFAAALFAREIARAQRASVEEAFLGALLHDVGRPILSELLVDMGEPAESRVTLIAELHPEVGAQVVAKWKLSARVVDLVRRHHLTLTAADSPLLPIVQLADAFAHRALGDGDFAALERHPARIAINLYDEPFARVAACRDAVCTAVGAMS